MNCCYLKINYMNFNILIKLENDIRIFDIFDCWILYIFENFFNNIVILFYIGGFIKVFCF